MKEKEQVEKTGQSAHLLSAVTCSSEDGQDDRDSACRYISVSSALEVVSYSYVEGMRAAGKRSWSISFAKSVSLSPVAVKASRCLAACPISVPSCDCFIALPSVGRLGVRTDLGIQSRQVDVRMR